MLGTRRRFTDLDRWRRAAWLAAVLLGLGLTGPAQAGGVPQAVRTIEGTLAYVRLEGGFWQLETQAGGRFVLVGADDALAALGAGSRVRVEGRPRPERASIYMRGTLFEVESVRPAP